MAPRKSVGRVGSQLCRPPRLGNEDKSSPSPLFGERVGVRGAVFGDKNRMNDYPRQPQLFTTLGSAGTGPYASDVAFGRLPFIAILEAFVAL
jgi:hypothetical protein